MANGITQAALWAAVFTPTADEIAREIVQQEWEMRQEEEKAYNEGFKSKTIERLRNHEAGANLLSFNKQPLYPHITQDMQADMLENGELKIIDLKSVPAIVGMWTDENREEAKTPIYLERKAKIEEIMSKGEYRIIS